LIVENLCLRQQLIVLQRRVPRPRLRDGDRRFWILVCRSFLTWRDSLLVIQLNTVLRWHRRGWTAYWWWRSRPRTRGGRPPLPRILRALIRRMAVENRLWGQRRVQAELARLGFPVSARTVAKYMRRPYDGVPSPTWARPSVHDVIPPLDLLGGNRESQLREPHRELAKDNLSLNPRQGRSQAVMDSAAEGHRMNVPAGRS
jgi:hypothetical protein